MSPIPADLLTFMETLSPPKGVNPADLLIKYNDLMNGNPPPVGAVHDDVLLREVAGWKITADIVVPEGQGPHPVLVYFHGGGWTMGSPKTHLRLGREFAAAGYLTLNVDYRRAPKHRFPAAFDDCLFATQWAVENAAQYGGDAQRLAVGGDSAGGNLAGAVLAECSQNGGPHIKAGVLLYGVFDYHKALAGLGTPRANQQFYLPVEEYEALKKDHRVSPLYACTKFPPCYITVGTKDPLLAESQELAKALTAAGVEHELHILEGAPHAFFQLPPLPAYAEGYSRAKEFLDTHV
jgi:acetyl esterase